VFLRLTGERRKPLILLSIGLTLAAAVLMFVGVKAHASAGVFLVAYILLSVSNGFGPAYVATIKELNRPESVGLAVAVYNCLAYVAVALLANLSGLVLDGFSDRATVTESGILYPPQAYATLFVVLMVLSGLSALCALLIPETRGQSLWRASEA